MAPRYRITLTQEEREMLEAVTRCGKTNAPKFIHARALLLCDSGPHGSGKPWKVADVAEALGVTSRTIEHLKERFVEQGLDSALGRGTDPLALHQSKRRNQTDSSLSETLSVTGY